MAHKNKEENLKIMILHNKKEEANLVLELEVHHQEVKNQEVKVM